MINAGDLVSGDGFSGLLHELIHGVSGFSYHYNLDAALTGDNMHVPGTCKYIITILSLLSPCVIYLTSFFAEHEQAL